MIRKDNQVAPEPPPTIDSGYMRELKEIANRIARDDKEWVNNMNDEMVTVIDEDGNEKEIPLNDAVLEWVEHYDWEECCDLMIDYLTLGDVQKLIVEAMTIEQKEEFLMSVIN